MKVFRKITQVIIVAMIVIATHSCYKDDANHHFRIPFKNDADYSLYVLSASKVLSVDYRLARQYTLSAFARMDNDLWVNEPVDRFYLGLTLKAKY